MIIQLNPLTIKQIIWCHRNEQPTDISTQGECYNWKPFFSSVQSFLRVFHYFWMANTENVLKERISKCVRSLSIFLSWLLGGSFSVRFSTSSVFRSNLPLDLTSIHISDWLLLRIRMMLYFWFIIPFSLLLSNWASVELTRPTGRQNIKVFLAIHRKILILFDCILFLSLSFHLDFTLLLSACSFRVYDYKSNSS